MWVVAMFDLPTTTKDERKAYQRFRKVLLKDGFLQIQFSVYARYCTSEENAVVHENRVEVSLPPDGEVRLMRLTDKQFERMKVFYGKNANQRKRLPNNSVFSEPFLLLALEDQPLTGGRL